MPDWVMCTRSAARVKLASSATATRYFNCRSSIIGDSSHQQKHELDFCSDRGARWFRSAPHRRNRGTPRKGGHPWLTARLHCAPKISPRLFVERANAGDADGIAELYQPNAVMAYPPGGVTVGRDAIRALWRQVLAGAPHFEPEPPLPTLVSGDIALSCTAAKDGAAARAQVVRRQPDGRWLRLLDRPEFAERRE